MARSIRIENPESVYHVYSRGNYREPIFKDFRTAEVFLKILEETIIRTDWHVYAFAIMPNHFHFVVKAPRANLSRGMHLLLTTFASRFNRFREEHGHVFILIMFVRVFIRSKSCLEVRLVVFQY
ncbi:hypothetical protein EBR11_07195 [bacterium]|nr:hypothetical protein [bacterium]